MHGCVSIWSQLILILVWSRLCNDPEKYFFESFIKIFWKGKYDITVHTQWVISREPHIITFPEKNRFWKFWILKRNYSKKPARKIFTLVEFWISRAIFPFARRNIVREIQNSTRVKIFRRVSYNNIPLIFVSSCFNNTGWNCFDLCIWPRFRKIASTFNSSRN